MLRETNGDRLRCMENDEQTRERTKETSKERHGERAGCKTEN